MIRVMELLIRVLMVIAKRLNNTMNMVIDLTENTAELFYNTKAEKKVIVKTLIMIGISKIMDVLISKNMNAVIELIRVVNNYVTTAEADAFFEAAICVLFFLIRDCVVIMIETMVQVVTTITNTISEIITNEIVRTLEVAGNIRTRISFDRRTAFKLLHTFPGSVASSLQLPRRICPGQVLLFHGNTFLESR